MKKILSFLFISILLISTSFAATIYEKPDVKIVVQGNEVELGENVAIIVNSRTLVPLRKLLVGLGVPDNEDSIKWIPEKMAVKVKYNGVTVDLEIGSMAGYINGQKYTLDTAPIIYKDRTYLPARFVGEALGYTISWDSYTPAVIVTDNNHIKELKNILTELNYKMDNVKNYEVITTKSTTRNYENSIITTIERADLENKIIYTEEQYIDEHEKAFTFSYNTNDALYSCYKYERDDYLYNTGWDIYSYDKRLDKQTPYNAKEKVGIIKISENLYGSLLYKEEGNEYILFTPTRQVDILKDLNLESLYEEVQLDYKNIKDFCFALAIDKESKMPKYLQITLNTISENIEYKVLFNNYNYYLELEIPRV